MAEHGGHTTHCPATEAIEASVHVLVAFARGHVSPQLIDRFWPDGNRSAPGASEEEHDSPPRLRSESWNC